MGWVIQKQYHCLWYHIVFKLMHTLAWHKHLQLFWFASLFRHVALDSTLMSKGQMFTLPFITLYTQTKHTCIYLLENKVQQRYLIKNIYDNVGFFYGWVSILYGHLLSIQLHRKLPLLIACILKLTTECVDPLPSHTVDKVVPCGTPDCNKTIGRNEAYLFVGGQTVEAGWQGPTM